MAWITTVPCGIPLCRLLRPRTLPVSARVIVPPFRQAVLFRIVDVGVELFAMAATCARAQGLLARDPESGARAVDLADLFCHQARGRVQAKFRGLWRNEDVRTYRVAQEVLDGKHRWLEEGMAESE
jgi:hypothetical protein